MTTTLIAPRQRRFKPGERIQATRSGGSREHAEVLEVRKDNVLRVRWPEGLETFYVPPTERPGREARRT